MRTHVLLTVNNPLAKLTSHRWDICQQHILCPHPTFSANMQKLDFLRMPFAGIWVMRILMMDESGPPDISAMSARPEGIIQPYRIHVKYKAEHSLSPSNFSPQLAKTGFSSVAICTHVCWDTDDGLT